MSQQHNLTYTCPKCGTTFSKPCIFAANEAEFNQIRSQLPTPFAEDPERKMCFNQAECPNEKCTEKRQYPVLVEGRLG